MDKKTKRLADILFYALMLCGLATYLAVGELMIYLTELLGFCQRGEGFFAVTGFVECSMEDLIIEFIAETFPIVVMVAVFLLIILKFGRANKAD